MLLKHKFLTRKVNFSNSIGTFYYLKINQLPNRLDFRIFENRVFVRFNIRFETKTRLIMAAFTIVLRPIIKRLREAAIVKKLFRFLAVFRANYLRNVLKFNINKH